MFLAPILQCPLCVRDLMVQLRAWVCEIVQRGRYIFVFRECCRTTRSGKRLPSKAAEQWAHLPHAPSPLLLPSFRFNALVMTPRNRPIEPLIRLADGGVAARSYRWRSICTGDGVRTVPLSCDRISGEEGGTSSRSVSSFFSGEDGSTFVVLGRNCTRGGAERRLVNLFASSASCELFSMVEGDRVEGEELSFLLIVRSR